MMEVLDFIQRPALPELWDGKTLWYKAVAEAYKCDGSKGYVVLRNTNGYDYRIIKAFGSVAAIREVKDIRPFINLKHRFILDFKTKEDILEYMVKKFGEKERERVYGLDSLSLKKLVFADALDNQAEDEKTTDEYYSTQYMETRDMEEDEKRDLSVFDDEKEELDSETEKKKENLMKMQSKAKNEKRGRKKSAKENQ